MPAGGMQIGGAYFTLDATAAPLIQALAQSEQASKKSVAAISQQTGIAERDVQRLAQTYIRAEQSRSNASAAATLKIIKAHNDEADAAERAATRQAQAAQRTGAGFGDAAKGALAFGATVAGLALGAEAVRASMEKVSEVTQRANQAQFALDATYKASAATYTQFSAQQAAATKRTNAEVQESIAAFGSLSNRYAFTSDQVKELTKRSADLAAVKGISTVEAAKRLEAALRGEAESAEFLGLTLNSDYLKKFANMSAEQRKAWETLDPLIKSQITYNELLKQTDPLVGTAVKRSTEATGANDRLRAAWDNLALSVGQRFNPALAAGTNLLAEYLERTQPVSKRNAEMATSFDDLARKYTSWLGPFSAIGFFDRATGRVQNRPRPGATEAESVPEAQEQARRAAAAQAAVAEDIRKRQEIAAATRKAQLASELAAADKANDATAESAIKAIDKERKEKEKWYDEERQRIEARRTYQLEDIDKRRDAALAAIEAEKQAAKDRFDQQIKDAEREKQVRLRVADEARDQLNAAIEDRRRQYAQEREQEDRDVADDRERQQREQEDRRANEDRTRERAHQAELRRQEEGHKRQQRFTEEEADAERRSSAEKLRNLERLAGREDERHRKALQALDDERDKRLSALDVQLNALDAQERQEQATRRTGDLQQRVAEAQRAASEARGTGTPEQVAEARAELTRAIRGGDPVSEANARERLVQLAGKGNAAIKKADEDLAKAQAELRQEGVDQARDAERERLKAAQDTVKADIDARKRQEDDRNRRRKDALDRDKQAEQDRLKDVLDKMDKRQQADQRAHEERIERINDEYKADSERLADARRDQDRERQDRQQAEDRDRQDRRQSEDAALQARREAAQKAYEQERQDAEEHYNGPNGVITQLRNASEATEREYSRQLVTARAAFEEERKAAERVYTNPEGNGQLQLLEQARQSEFDKLEASKAEWQAWQKAASESIKAAMADLDEFIKRGANVPRIGGDREAQRHPGSGKLTSTSDQETRSDYNGKKYQGDWVTWLNDAMDITGVGNDWFNGLQRLASLENAGHDPALPNREGSGATGLLQVMPGTFSSYRDKSLPDDITDPVANLVAAINYIMDTYGHVNNIPGLNGGTFKGYAQGGWVHRPSYLVDARSGQAWGTIAEREPEYVTPAGRMVGYDTQGPPLPNYAAMGAAMHAIHPNGAVTTTYSDSYTVNGVGVDEFMGRIRLAQDRNRVLRGRFR